MKQSSIVPISPSVFLLFALILPLALSACDDVVDFAVDERRLIYNFDISSLISLLRNDTSHAVAVSRLNFAHSIHFRVSTFSFFRFAFIPLGSN